MHCYSPDVASEESRTMMHLNTIAAAAAALDLSAAAVEGSAK